ncbi:MAG: T9SS type A sorting domain-containing protein [Flavobacteriales bacterium]|nr:T9SS type A sorting domain-containing protein [Flavobacteriales bacterium]
MKLNKQFIAGLIGLAMSTTLAYGQGIVVEEVIIINGGVFEYEPCTCIDYVTMSSLITETREVTVFDTIYVQSANSVITDAMGEFAYAAASDSLVMYDLSDYSRVNAIKIAGIQRMAIYGGNLIVTKGYGSFEDYVEVYDKRDLSLLKVLSTVSDEAKDILVVGDTGYVSVPGNWMATAGKLAIIDLTTMELVREETLDTNYAGIGSLLLGGDKIYTINSKAWNKDGTIGTFDIASGTMDSVSLLDAKITGGLMVKDDLIYTTIEGVLGTISTTDMMISTDVLINKPLSGSVLDTSANLIWATETDFSSYGKVVAFDLSGQGHASWDVGISVEGLALVYGFSDVGIADRSKGDLGVSPNPARDHVNIRSSVSKGSYQVTDILGKVVLSGQNNKSNFRLDVSELKAGVYFINVSDKSTTATRRLIKQ